MRLAGWCLMLMNEHFTLIKYRFMRCLSQTFLAKKLKIIYKQGEFTIHETIGRNFPGHFGLAALAAVPEACFVKSDVKNSANFSVASRGE
jgi:hypothetical protein